MNYTKIANELLKENYIDERMLLCHSYKSYTVSQDRFVYTKFTRIGNNALMPSFMLLSLKDDKLIISYAKAFGGFKKYYASIKLSRLKFVEKMVLDRTVNVYVFDLFNDLGEKIENFFIIAIKGKNEAEKLVQGIIDSQR